MTRPLVPIAAVLLALAAASGPARAIEVGNPNLSRDAAQCGRLTDDFKKAMAGRADDPLLADTKRLGERGAYLCRFERYREGITRLQDALATLHDTPAK